MDSLLLPSFCDTKSMSSTTGSEPSENEATNTIKENLLEEQQSYDAPTILIPHPPRSFQPKPYGQVHPTLQQVESLVHDVDSLRCSLGSDDPLLNWQGPTRRDIDLCNIKTWFPSDDNAAFYTPADGLRYDTLSFRELHHEIDQCPPFVSYNNDSNTKVAIIIPGDRMAHMATALLSTVASGAVAVPLDPRMPTIRVLEAIEQLQCDSIVATESILMDGKLPLLRRNDDGTYTISQKVVRECQDNDETSRLLTYFNIHMEEIRIVHCGVCGRLQWTVLVKSKEAKNATENVTWRAKTTIEITNTGKSKETRSPQDTTMLLRTSGTTSKPKIVPISLSMLAFAGTSIAAALQLKRRDINCNSMPFYHIGGVACNLLAVLVSGGSVILAGPLTDANIFLDHLVKSPRKEPTATWYYAGPSMHKAILLMAESRWLANNKSLPNELRFIRSASAHLNHDLALRLSKVFQCQVIPTYGMSEAMPICSSAPIDVRNEPPCEVVDSVGYSVGTSIRILDPETDEILAYGADQIGEIAVKGAGVVSHYVGMDTSRTHTPDGWLKTGDRGTLDKKGRLFIKGRSKEMIKRGGEQVWPNEIDDVIEKVAGVATAVTFGVPNELWGEEVAVAVVLSDAHQIENKGFLKSLEEDIIETCRCKLDDLSMPQQIKFLSSTELLLKGSTGKYIRSKMATHLGVTAVDTGALRVLTTVSQFAASEARATPFSPKHEESDDKPAGKWDWLDSKRADGRRVMPSDALNGVRFLVACVVVNVHVGLFPNLPWIKLQAYQPNMMIFFGIAAFQSTCSVARSVKDQWASFVGSKIGSLHALFVLSQLFNLPSYILFNAFDDDGNMDWSVGKWIGFSTQYLFATVTGLGHGFDVNKYTWFQSTFYMFLMVFPFLDHYLRRESIKIQGIVLVLSGITAFGLWGLLYLTVPSDIFWGPLYPFGWSIVTWLPLLVTGMAAAYFFQRFAEYYLQVRDRELEEQGRAPLQPDDPETLQVEEVKAYSRVWGVVCDVCSVLLLVAAVAVAVSPNCLCVYGDTFEAMRPGAELPEEECPFSSGREDYVWACEITYNEFTDYIQPDPHHKEYGRFPTNFGGAFGYLRLGSPLILLWISSMGFGTGLTARFFSSKLMTALAPLGYPVYLIHIAIARYYWLATRGFQREDWFDISGEYPFPVEWYEMFLILAITIVIGFLINSYLVPPLMPYSISLGVKVCNLVSSTVATLTRRERTPRTMQESSGDGDAKISPTYDQVRTMVRGLTGVEVNRSNKLRYLGLDSLGATALLGMLRASVPAAKQLTLQQLQECETVGCLSDMLEEPLSMASNSEDEERSSAAA